MWGIVVVAVVGTTAVGAVGNVRNLETEGVVETVGNVSFVGITAKNASEVDIEGTLLEKLVSIII